jgi:ankyrin repeat protein
MLYVMHMEEHWLSVLGFDPVSTRVSSLTEADLKRAYRRRALRVHPNKGGSEEDFQALTSALESLQNVLRPSSPRVNAVRNPKPKPDDMTQLLWDAVSGLTERPNVLFWIKYAIENKADIEDRRKTHDLSQKLKPDSKVFDHASGAWKKDLGKTPLVYAAGMPNGPESVWVRAVQLLLDGGANVLARGGADEGTPLHNTASSNLGWYEEPLWQVASMIIKKDPATVLARNARGSTPLHEACSMHRPRLVDAMIRANPAAVHARDDRGWTPLHSFSFKSSRPRLEIVESLVAAGADVNAVARDAWTPLHVAAAYGDSSTVKALLDRGANKLALTDGGETPLDLARSKKYRDKYRSNIKDILKLLRKDPPASRWFTATGLRRLPWR